MSSDCIYKAFVIRIPAKVAAQPEDQFMLITLVGSSNCYDWNDRRVRSWQIAAMGDRQAIMAEAIYSASGFSGGTTYFGNFGQSGALSPQDYIAKVRRMLTKALELDSSFGVCYGGTRLWLKARTGTICQGLVQSALQVAVESNQPYRHNRDGLLAIEGASY